MGFRLFSSILISLNIDIIENLVLSFLEQTADLNNNKKVSYAIHCRWKISHQNYVTVNDIMHLRISNLRLFLKTEVLI